MDCPHATKEAGTDIAICSRCVEVAESYSAALSQSMLLTTQKQWRDAAPLVPIAGDKWYPTKVARLH